MDEETKTTRSDQSVDSWSQMMGLGWDQFVEHEGFGELMEISAKMTAAVRDELERSVQRWLHLFNLPSASDVRQLSEQVESLERHLQALRRAVDNQARAAATTHRSDTASVSDTIARPALNGSAAQGEPAARADAVVRREPTKTRAATGTTNGVRRVSRSQAAASARRRTEATGVVPDIRSNNGWAVPGNEV